MIVDHLWQSTVCVAVAALLAWLTRRNDARIRVWIWFAASLKFFAPLSMLIALGTWAAASAPRALPVEALIVPSAVIDVVTQPFSGQLATAWAEPASTASHNSPTPSLPMLLGA